MAYQRITSDSGTSGGYRPIAGSFAMPASLGTAAEAEPGHSPLDILGNFLGGVKDIGMGLAGLVSSSAHDTGRLWGQILPGRQDWGIISDNPEDQYRLDDIATQLPGAIIDDFATRYGALLPGGRPASEFLDELAEKPASFLLDALGVGAVAGKAVQGAGLAGKAGQALGISGPATLARAGGEAGVIAEGVAGALARAGIRGTTAQAAGVRAGLDELANAGRLSSTMNVARRLLPSPTVKAVGETGFAASAEFQNPVLRALVAPAKKAMSEPITKLEQQAGRTFGEVANTLAAPASEPFGREIAAANLFDDYVSQAKSLGLSRIARPAVRNLNLRVASAKTVTRLAAEHLLRREKAATVYREVLEGAIADDATVADRYHVVSTGLDVDISDVDTEGWAARYGTGDTAIPGGTDLSLEARTALNTHLEGLAELEANAASILAGASGPKGVLRAVRKLLGEERYAQLKPLLGDGSDLEAILRELVRSDEGGGILREALDLEPGKARTLMGQKVPQTPPVEAGPVFRGIPGVSPSAATPVGKAAKSTASKRSGTGVAAAIADEIRQVVGGDDALRMVIGDAQTSSEILARVRRFINDPETLPRHVSIDTPPARPLAASAMLDDTERALLDADDPIVQRTDAVVAKIDEQIARFEADRENLAATGWDVDAEIEASQRLKAGLYDGLRRRAQGYEDRTIQATDEMRLVDAEQFGDLFPVLGARPSDILSRAYLPLRLKYGARFVGDELVGGPSVAELDDALRAAGRAQPTYFPYIDAEMAKPSDWFRSRSMVGANVYAKDPHAKQLKGVLLKEGTYISDPVEAFARRSSRAVREIETYRTFSTLVKTFGRRIRNKEDVPPGWSVVAPDAMFVHHRQRLEMLDELDRLKSEGLDSDAALAKVLEKVGHRSIDEVEAALENGANLWAVPEQVVKSMNRASELAQVFAGKGARLYVDAPMNAWRALVLTASPRWLVNNVLGNTIFGLMQGVKVADVMRILTERMRAMLANWVAKRGDLGKAFSDWLGGSQIRENSLAGQALRLPGGEDVGSGFVGTLEAQYTPRMGAAADTATGRAYARLGATSAAGKARKWSQAVKHLNAEIESSFREASYLTAIEKMQGRTAIRYASRKWWNSKERMERIMADGFDETKAAAALNEVDQFFGNYAKMSPFERHVIRRFISPFWGFYRHQIKLLASFPFNSPVRAQVLAGLTALQEEMLEAYGPVPEWLEGATPLGPPGSEVTFLTSRGMNPFSASFESPIGALSPPLSIALEQMLGQNLYTGEPFSDEGVIENFGGMRFRMETDENGNPVPVPVEGVAPGLLEHLLQQIPQYDMAKQIIGGGRPYDTANLGTILAGRLSGSGAGVEMDEETGEPKFPTGPGEQLAKLLGFPTKTVDLEGYQSFLGNQQETALKAFLRQQNPSL